MKLAIYQRIWPTLLLVATCTIASAAIGLLIGIYGGWRRGSRLDVASQGFTHVADVLNHLALPWFVLTIAFIGE